VDVNSAALGGHPRSGSPTTSSAGRTARRSMNPTPPRWSRRSARPSPPWHST